MTLKPIPNIDDDAAMIARGRRSAIHSARNDACEALRAAFVAIQSMQIGGAEQCLEDAELAIKRLREIAVLWSKFEGKS